MPPFPRWFVKSGASSRAGNQQPGRQAQTAQVNHPVSSAPGFTGVPPPIANGSLAPFPPATNNPQASISTAPALQDGEQILGEVLERNSHLSDSELVLKFSKSPPPNDQTSGLPEQDPPAIRDPQGSNPLVSGSEDYVEVEMGEEEEGSGQQGPNWNSLGPQVPAQASGTGLCETRSYQEAPRLQSWVPGPQTAGSGYYQPNDQARRADLQGLRGPQWGSQAFVFPPGPSNGNQFHESQVHRNQASEMQLTYPQSSALQTRFSSLASSNANMGYQSQAQSQQAVYSRIRASQSMHSSGGLISAAQMDSNLRNQRGQQLWYAYRQRDSENISQRSNSMHSAPELPRPPRDAQAHSGTSGARYCMSCGERLASFALRCDLCKDMISKGFPECRHCIFCKRPASGPKHIVCATHEKRLGVRLTRDEKKVLEREHICKRCYKADACPGILKCERCRSDQKRYGSTSRETRGQRQVCLNCTASVAGSGYQHCEACRQKKANGSKLSRQQARDKG